MSDEFFTSYDIRGKVQEGASLETAWNIGKALADWLPTYGKVVVVRGDGADERLFGALIEGLRLQGRDVIDGAKGDKDSLINRIKGGGLSGGVLVSHDIDQDVCVIELFDDKAQLIASESGLKAIAELVEAGNFVPSATKGELTAIV
ncbi:MAG: hypothetical protein ABJA64_02755 [Candidatus Saccharibacteria bacterium]